MLVKKGPESVIMLFCEKVRIGRMVCGNATFSIRMVIAGCHLTSFQNETNVPDRSSPHFSLQLVVVFAESRIPVNPRSLSIFKRLNVFLPLIMATSLLKESMKGGGAAKLASISIYSSCQPTQGKRDFRYYKL